MAKNLERNMLVSESDLKLLPTIFVLLGPFGIIFPFQPLIVQDDLGKNGTNFMISLSFTILLISDMTVELTHTMTVYKNARKDVSRLTFFAD